MTMLTSDALSVGAAGIYGVLGYAVVFFGLILLMAVVIIMGKFFTKNKAKSEPAGHPAPVAHASAPVAVPAPEVTDAAPGTAGQLKTYDVPPKTCAMLMAIVADTMGKPLNELRFISIKEVK